MPKVGKKEFAYTPKGMAMAKAEAKKTGGFHIPPRPSVLGPMAIRWTHPFGIFVKR